MAARWALVAVDKSDQTANCGLLLGLAQSVVLSLVSPQTKRGVSVAAVAAASLTLSVDIELCIRTLAGRSSSQTAYKLSILYPQK